LFVVVLIFVNYYKLRGIWHPVSFALLSLKAGRRWCYTISIIYCNLCLMCQFVQSYFRLDWSAISWKMAWKVGSLYLNMKVAVVH